MDASAEGWFAWTGCASGKRKQATVEMTGVSEKKVPVCCAGQAGTRRCGPTRGQEKDTTMTVTERERALAFLAWMCVFFIILALVV